MNSATKKIDKQMIEDTDCQPKFAYDQAHKLKLKGYRRPKK